MIRPAAILALAGTLYAGPAAADFCGDREAETVFFCKFEGSSRQVHVCRHEDNSFHYAYGRANKAPELELRHGKNRVTYTPWNGIGRAIWASLGFRNGPYLYEVAFSADRLEPGPTEGVLTVMKGEDILTTKRCRPSTLVQSLDELEDLFLRRAARKSFYLTEPHFAVRPLALPER